MTRLFIICFLGVAFAASGQVNIVNTDLTDTTRNIVYQGIYNNIKLTGIKDVSKVILKSTSCEITNSVSGEDGFTLHTMELGFDTVYVMKGGKILLKKVFEIKRFPDPTLTLNDQLKTEFTVRQLLVFGKLQLRIILPNSFYKHRYWSVSRFHIEFYKSNGELLSASDEYGDFLNKEHLATIKTLEAGDKISFEATGIGPSGGRVIPWRLTITII